MGKARLSRKQFIWLTYYLGEARFNATEAARRAGYKCPRSSGSENLHKPAIQEAIARWWNAKGMATDEVLGRLADIARGDIGELITDEGKISLVRAKELGLTKLIKAISDTDRGLRVEMYDALEALQLIGKHLGLFRETVDVRSIDLAKLSDEQLERIANGEDPASVLATSSTGGAGEAPPQGDSAQPAA